MNVSRLGPVLLIALAGVPRPARACSPPQCWPGFFTPGDGATVPANLPAIYWRPVSSYDAPPDPEMVVLSAASNPQTALPFTATQMPNGDYLIVPDAPLVAGTDYTIVDQTACGMTPNFGPHVTFHVVAEAPLPASLGTLAIVDHQEEMFSVGTARGSCSSEVLADQARLELTPSDDALPWKDALHYQTMVDGLAWGSSTSINASYAPGSSWVGIGVDRLYHVCSTDDDTIGSGLALGTHQAAMTATLPGASFTIDAAAVPVDLECGSGSGSGSNGPVVDDAGDGCNACGGSSAFGVLLALGVCVRKRRRA